MGVLAFGLSSDGSAGRACAVSPGAVCCGGFGVVEGAADVLLGEEPDAEAEAGADVEREAGAAVLELEAAVVDDACVLAGEPLL